MWKESGGSRDGGKWHRTNVEWARFTNFVRLSSSVFLWSWSSAIFRVAMIAKPIQTFRVHVLERSSG